MNLPNKLTICRILLIPFFVVSIASGIDRIWEIYSGRHFYYSEPDRFCGWKNCPEIQSCHEFWEVYGSFGR